MRELLFLCILFAFVCGGLCGFCNQCFFNGNYSSEQTVNENDERMEELIRRLARLGIGFRAGNKNKRMCLDAKTHEFGESSDLGGEFGPTCVVVNFRYKSTEAIYRAAYNFNLQKCINDIKLKIKEYETSVSCCQPSLKGNLGKCRDGNIVREGTVLGAASIKASVFAISLTLIIGILFAQYSWF